MVMNILMKYKNNRHPNTLYERERSYPLKGTCQVFILEFILIRCLYSFNNCLKNENGCPLFINYNKEEIANSAYGDIRIFENQGD